MNKGYNRITKSEFYAWGGFSNPHLVRTTVSNQFTYWSEK